MALVEITAVKVQYHFSIKLANKKDTWKLRRRIKDLSGNVFISVKVTFPP